MTRALIADAAFDLFRRQGYDATSVDDIAAAAGVSRSTFFRQYGSKEAVVFPDHDLLIQQVERRLNTATQGSGLHAVIDAVKVVLTHYVAEGERARERYRLTSTVTALRDRELGSTARYQHVFRSYLSSWSDGSEEAELKAEVAAAAVVAAHNRVLRRWLRNQTSDPHTEVERALHVVHDVFEPSQPESRLGLVVVPSGTDLTELEDAIRRVVRG